MPFPRYSTASQKPHPSLLFFSLPRAVQTRSLSKLRTHLLLMTASQWISKTHCVCVFGSFRGDVGASAGQLYFCWDSKSVFPHTLGRVLLPFFLSHFNLVFMRELIVNFSTANSFMVLHISTQVFNIFYLGLLKEIYAILKWDMETTFNMHNRTLEKFHEKRKNACSLPNLYLKLSFHWPQ